MMGKPEVEAAAMDVEGVAQVLRRHRGALEMPARASCAPRRAPCRGLRLTLLVPLPQGEVPRVALAARIGIRSVLHLVHALPGQLAVGRPGADVEVHVSRSVLCGIGVACVDQPLDQSMHLGDVPRGAGLVPGLSAPRARHRRSGRPARTGRRARTRAPPPDSPHPARNLVRRRRPPSRGSCRRCQ